MMLCSAVRWRLSRIHQQQHNNTTASDVAPVITAAGAVALHGGTRKIALTLDTKDIVKIIWSRLITKLIISGFLVCVDGVTSFV